MGHNRGRSLPQETVRSIRRAVDIGNDSIAEIARKHRVGRTSIYRILNDRRTLASKPPLSAQTLAPAGA